MTAGAPARDPFCMSREQLIAEIQRLRLLVSQHLRSSGDLTIESGVNQAGEPFVTLRWGNEAGQLGPDEARAHAMRVIEVAVAADHDALLWKVLRGHDLSADAAAGMLVEMRNARGAADGISGQTTWEG